jgi:hypothetical protein
VDLSTSIDGSDPARMVFVFHAPCDFLPQELARFHALGLGFKEELALAPWGIDAATDELFARRCRPRNLFVLAADNLNALFWGLHDWAHFHNHGPLDEPALTELQCDSAALVWMWRNRGALGLTEARWEKARGEVSALNGRRFRDEGLSFDDHLLDPKILWDLAKNLAKPGSRKPLPDECAIAAPP